jgi:hypothetical protein
MKSDVLSLREWMCNGTKIIKTIERGTARVRLAYHR